MQTRLAEVFNASSHGLGTLLSVTALVLLVVFSAMTGEAISVVSCSIYGVSLVLLYTASTLYHAIARPKLKAVFKIMDHASIYLLIAGTYTPFMLVTLRGAWGWSIFGVIWGLALIGLVFKLFFTGRYEFVSVAMYILMGWLVVVAIRPLIDALPFAGLVWLVAGGLCYTVGVIFYAIDHRYTFAHFVWHLFVLAGSICHFFAILFYVVLR